MPTRAPQLLDSGGHRRPPAAVVDSGRPVDAWVQSSVFPSELGWMGLIAECSPIGKWAITRLAFGHATAAAVETALGLPQAASWGNADNQTPAAKYETSDNPTETWGIPATWVSDLQAFAAGAPTDLNHLPLDLSHLTDFGRRVVLACRQIPWGQTMSYGELANRSGAPGAARAVGGVMARNRHPLVIPCHRVLASTGALTGFSAPQGLVMKQRLLAHERSIEVGPLK